MKVRSKLLFRFNSILTVTLFFFFPLKEMCRLVAYCSKWSLPPLNKNSNVCLGALSHSVEAIILVGPTNSSIDVEKLQTTIYYLHETGSPADKEVVAPSSSSDVVTDEPEVDVPDETHELVTFIAGEREEVMTTSPTTHSPSVKLTTSPVLSTADAVEPAIHSFDVGDFAKEAHDPNFPPASKEDVTTAAVHTTTTLRTDIPAHEDGEILTSEDGSGDVVRT